jgi:hypothetical protein
MRRNRGEIECAAFSCGRTRLFSQPGRGGHFPLIAGGKELAAEKNLTGTIPRKYLIYIIN